MPLSNTGAELLFEMIWQRQESGATLITRNLQFDEWPFARSFGPTAVTGSPFGSAAPEKPNRAPDHSLQSWPCGPMRNATRQLPGERAPWRLAPAAGLVPHQTVAGFVFAVDSRVEDAAFFGTHVRAHVVPLAAPEIRLTVHLPQSAASAPGDIATLSATDYLMLEA